MYTFKYRFQEAQKLQNKVISFDMKKKHNWENQKEEKKLTFIIWA